MPSSSLDQRIKGLKKELEQCRSFSEQIARERVLRYKLDKAEEQKGLFGNNVHM
jgi:hypothetical protein